MIQNLIVVTSALSLVLWLAGCSGNDPHAPQGEPAESAGHEGHDHAAEAEHEHPTEGPHGGHLIELGEEEYHAELTHDEATHTVTVYLLDAAGKVAVPIEQDSLTLQLFQDGQFVDYELKPSGETSPAGASEFSIQNEPATDALLHAEQLRGRLRVTIGGKQYNAIIEHAAHDHAGHKH